MNIIKSRVSGFLFILYAVLFFAHPTAAAEVVTVVEVRIQGNLRVEEDGIRIHLKARPGTPLDSATVDQDVKSIYRMGFFDDVKAELSPGGILTYIVKEKAYIKDITIEGNSKVAKDKIETALGVRPRTILDKDKVLEGVEKVRKLYEENGYGNAHVDYAISPAENNQASIMMNIAEGEQLLIEKISFEGNRAFSDSELKGLMATKEKLWLLSFISNRGVLDQDMLTNDVAVLSSHYYDHGYVRHKIDEPVILRGPDGIQIVIRIQEGEQYRVAKVELGGDMPEDPVKLLQSIKLTSGQILRGSRLRDDITALTDKYTNRGFAFVKVEPVTKIDDRAKTVDVAYVITRGPPVYFNRVVIAGNTKTRDKVVRREVKVGEQELFSGSKIKESRNALQRTGYFDDVQLNTKKTDRPDTVDLLVDVKEGSTGTFSIGAGYDSGNSVSLNLAVTERNLFGRGQSLSANGTIGSVDQNFTLSFAEPYVNDTPLSLGAKVFKTKNEYSSFKLKQLGFAVITGYPLSELRLPFSKTGEPVSPYDAELPDEEEPYSYLHYMRAGVTYGLTHQDIYGVSDNASQDLKDSEGTSLTSAVTPSISYDSRDHYFLPMEGAISNASLKFAGLGGTTYFVKGDLFGKWYYPLLKDPNWGGTYTFSIGGAIGYGVGFNGPSNLPLFERYFPGGINSVRGFEDRSLGPHDKNGDLIGGEKQGILNVELIFPILERMGLRGVAFFDMGQAFRRTDQISWGGFRRSVGFGARWLSPFGPLRAELGFPLNAKPEDKTSILGFSFGGQ